MGWRAFKRRSLGRTYWLNSQAWTLMRRRLRRLVVTVKGEFVLKSISPIARNLRTYSGYFLVGWYLRSAGDMLNMVESA